MKLREYKEMIKLTEGLGDMVKNLEYSPLNTLSQPRKDLHRKFLIPEMDKEMQNIVSALKDIEDGMIQIGIKNPDDVDIDEFFKEEELTREKYDRYTK